VLGRIYGFLAEAQRFLGKGAENGSFFSRKDAKAQRTARGRGDCRRQVFGEFNASADLRR
jgi:hypothetical protein